MNLKELLNLEIQESEKKLHKLQKELETAPDGYIVRAMFKYHKPQYYFSKNRKDKNGTYLSKNQISLIRALLQRDYNKKIAAELKKQLQALQKCNKRYSPTKLENIFAHTSKQRQCQINPLYIPEYMFIQNWKSTPYIPKEFSTDTPFHITANGEKVRSKSENIIADTLLHLNIPYRYESSLSIGNKIFHPDFICLNTRTRKEYIWEHFGLMDDSEYVSNTVSKIKFYNRYGYYIGKNLIVTFETQKTPLFSYEIEKTAKEYLL